MTKYRIRLEDRLNEYASSYFKNGYSSWKQLAGYFDGDGSLLVRIRIFTINIMANWSDCYKPQIDNVDHFLQSEVMTTPNIFLSNRPKSKVWNLRLTERGGLLRALNPMLPWLFKKRSQVQAGIDYLEDRVTGDQLIARFNEAINLGMRSSNKIAGKQPWNKRQGTRLAHALAGRERSDLKHLLTRSKLKEAALGYMELGISVEMLAERYNVNVSELARALQVLAAPSSQEPAH